MIIFIIIPPGDRLYKQRILHDLFWSEIKLPRVVCVVPIEEVYAWRRLRPKLEFVEYHKYDQRIIRTMILNEFGDEDIHVIARDDLALSRRLPSIGRMAQCTKLDIQVLLKWIKNASFTYTHGSVSERRHNKITSEKMKIVASPSLLNFYTPNTVFDVDFNFFDAPESLVDHDLTLWLLREGYPNIVNHEFSCRSVSEKFEISKMDAFALEQCYPDLVEAVETRPGKWTTVCQWRKTYDPSR